MRTYVDGLKLDKAEHGIAIIKFSLLLAAGFAQSGLLFYDGYLPGIVAVPLFLISALLIPIGASLLVPKGRWLAVWTIVVLLSLTVSCFLVTKQFDACEEEWRTANSTAFEFECKMGAEFLVGPALLAAICTTIRLLWIAASALLRKGTIRTE